MSPTGSLTTTRTCTLPKTIRSLNLRIISNSCPTTNRLQLQPMTQRKVPRRHRNRTKTTNNFELFWLYHCTYRSEEQVQNDRNFITPSDRRWPLDKWNLCETQGNVFGNLRLMFESSQTPNQGILHSTAPSATGAIPVQVSTGYLSREMKKNWEHNSNADVCRNAVDHQFSFASGNTTEFYGWTGKTADIKFPTPSTFSCWKKKDSKTR